MDLRLLITGGAGFIGNHLIKCALSEGHTVVALDKLTYAGNILSLKSIENHPAYMFVHGDIADSELVRKILEEHRPNAVINLAAESHVDRSIDDPLAFIQTNIVGTYCLLDASRRYYENLTGDEKESFRFFQISTDEVFGSLGESGFFCESTAYAPNSPYSASKASADHLVRAWFHTYKLPVLITNCCNNYGPFQFPEKLVPHMILSAIKGMPLPVYGDGRNIRDWLYVEDHCRAIMTVLRLGVVGETYVIGAQEERTNLQIVHAICDILDDFCPRTNGASYREQIAFVKDRPGHDLRYAIDPAKIRSQLQWAPAYSFEEGIRETVRWYLDNESWVQSILNGQYRLARIGEGNLHK